MKETKANWLKYSSAGFEIIASLLLFGYLGYLSDGYFKISPFGILSGLLLGSALSLYQLWKKLSK